MNSTVNRSCVAGKAFAWRLSSLVGPVLAKRLQPATSYLKGSKQDLWQVPSEECTAYGASGGSK